MKTILSLFAALFLFSCTSSKKVFLNQRQGQLKSIEWEKKGTAILTFKPILSKDTAMFQFRYWGANKKSLLIIGDKYTIRYDSVRKGDCKVLATLKQGVKIETKNA